MQDIGYRVQDLGDAVCHPYGPIGWSQWTAIHTPPHIWPSPTPYGIPTPYRIPIAPHTFPYPIPTAPHIGFPPHMVPYLTPYRIPTPYGIPTP